MRIAMHEITSVRASFEEDLTAYRAAGWTAFEMSLDKANAAVQRHGVKGVRQLVRESRMTPIAATGHVVRAFASREAVAANEREFAAKLAVMEAVGCPVLVFGGDALPPVAAPSMSETGLAERDRAYREGLAAFVRQVARLADLAAPSGVSLALEMNWCGMCRSVVTAAEAIRLADRPNVGLIFDTAHFACTPSRIADLELVRGKIIAGHLNDMRDAPPEVRNVNNDRVVPGDGVLPLVAWLAAVEECGFTGWHAVELFCEDLWRETAETIARRVLEGCRRLWPDAQF
jgi:4-hydroxyphenylpyruvate dioxygenase